MLPPDSQRELQFRVQGLDCAEEVALLKAALGPLVGEERLGFDLLQARLIVTGGPASAEQIVKAVAAAGLRAEPWRPGPTSQAAHAARHARTVLTAASGLLTLAGLAAQTWLGGQAWLGGTIVPPAAAVLYALATLGGVALVLPKAWGALLRLRPDMNLLMTVAVCGAMAIGEWFEAATVAFLFALSLLLEAWSVGRARRAVAALLDLSPPTARTRGPDGAEIVLPAEEVAVSSLIVVRPGERIPLDGHVTAGVSHVNQAPITGESLPVLRQPGDAVFAGTVNGDGALEIRTDKPAGDTTLAHIIRLVAQAQTRRAPSEQFVERFARVYTPAVMGLALALAILPPLFAGGDWSGWLYRALVLLVIACPCALVISTPVTIVAALTAAARRGVLVKGGQFMEAPARLAALAFDKTGTLTTGRPAVVEIVPLSGHDDLELLARAAALEARSDHPIAHAVVQYAQARQIDVTPASDVQALPGKGVTGRFNDETYWLGSHRYLEERGQETPAIHQALVDLAQDGRTVVVVGNERHVCGLIAVADEVRPEAARAVAELRGLGIRRIVMLTGDNRPTAEAVARQIGLDDVQAELLPADKVAAVERLVAEQGRVAMVGDGVNDAPAMARATLGVAMGAAASDAAIETADVALMADDLLQLPWLVRHSRRAVAVIYQNIAFALTVKAAFLILAFLGHSSLWAAIAADTGASLLVVFNGLRLLASGTSSERPPAPPWPAPRPSA